MKGITKFWKRINLSYKFKKFSQIHKEENRPAYEGNVEILISYQLEVGKQDLNR